MRSPHALSRGKVDLSTRATRAPSRANTSAATLPAGPAPTTSASKRPVVIGWPFPRRVTVVFSGRGDAVALRTQTDPNRFARELFRGLPRRYDALAELLSFGQNGRWRRAMVDQIVPASPGRVLDVAAGTAGVSIQLAQRTPARVVGIDLTEAMLREGTRRVGRSRPWGNAWISSPVGPNSCRSRMTPSTA